MLGLSVLPVYKYQGHMIRRIKGLKRGADKKDIRNEERMRHQRNKDNVRLNIDRPLG